MKILAVDTSTMSLSVAITGKSGLLSEITVINNQTHSIHLINLIERALGISGLSIKDIDGYAVTNGPGTFTGLRIGISTIKGLAAATHKPIVGISSLEALASQAGPAANLICPFMDARRGEIYTNLYRSKNGRMIQIEDERVIDPSEMIDQICETCIFIGNGAKLYREIIEKKLGEKAVFASEKQNIIQASSIAYLGRDRFTNLNTEDNTQFVPVYIRKSDAEIKK